MLDHNGPGHFGSSFALGFSEPNFVEKFEGNNFRTNPEQAMASSATSATSFELIEDQALTAEEVEMASQEAQEVRTREAAVAAGLVLDEPEAPPSASATDVMNDLSSALERLRVAFSTPTPGLGASGPAEDEDKEMSDAVTTERATPPTKRLKGFVAASQKTTAPVNKPVSLVPVDGRPGYFKLVDLPDLFPVLPADLVGLRGLGAQGYGGHGQRQRAHAPPDVPDLAGLQGARPADGPAGWLLFPGAPDGPDGVQQEPERSEVLIDLGHAGLRSMGKKSTALSTDLPLHHWHDLRCNHGSHPRGEKLNSSDLSRYPTREPSPSTPGDNKRQSRRLKALAGLTLGSLPVSASDTPASGTSTQRTGEVGGKLFPWTHGHTRAWRFRIGLPSYRSLTTPISPTRSCEQQAKLLMQGVPIEGLRASNVYISTRNDIGTP